MYVLFFSTGRKNGFAQICSLQICRKYWGVNLGCEQLGKCGIYHVCHIFTYSSVFIYLRHVKGAICANPFFRPVQVFFKMFLRELLLYCIVSWRYENSVVFKTKSSTSFSLKHRQFLWSMTGKYTRKKLDCETFKSWMTLESVTAHFPLCWNWSRQLVSYAVFLLSMVLVTIKFIKKTQNSGKLWILVLFSLYSFCKGFSGMYCAE